MTSYKKILAGIICLFLVHSAQSQHQEINEKPEIYKGVRDTGVAAGSLLEAFRKGSINGHFRYFFMATQNENGLTDYYAQAAGGGLRFETGRFHGFQVAVSGFYTFNLTSSDFLKPDSTTGQYDRYEVALFDIENPSQRSDLDRLEEFYLRYNFKGGKVIFGRQLINTPFINLQDGRMRPTGVNGFWAEWNAGKKWKLKGGWIYDLSPRGTMRWFNAGKSIGVFSTGVNPDGTPSGYSNQISSYGIALVGASAPLNRYLRLQAWNVFVENVSNTSFIQLDAEKKLSSGQVLFAGVQATHQEAIHDGGNTDPSKTYFQKGGSSDVFGLRAGIRGSSWEADLNYTRITAAGRYLMPREWGRDPFFTFLPRERNEGFGNVNAFMARFQYGRPAKPFRASLAAGYYDLPDVKDYRLNKYGLPSYLQANMDLRYRFKGVLGGLEAQLLVAGKLGRGETYNNMKYVINKVNLLNYNLVFNFYF